MVTKEELLEDFLTFLDTAINTYCEEMQLDEETADFLLQEIGLTSDEEEEVEEDEENGTEKTPQFSEEQLGTAFRQFLSQNQFASLNEGFEAFSDTHKLDELSRKTLAGYIKKASGDALSDKSAKRQAGVKKAADKLSEQKTLTEQTNPKMARYLRALGC